MDMCKFSISRFFRPIRNSGAQLSRIAALWGRLPATAAAQPVVYEISLRRAGPAGTLSGVAEVYDLGDGFGFRARCFDRNGKEHSVHGAMRTSISFAVLAPVDRPIHREYFTPDFVPVDGATRTFALSLAPIPTVLHGPNPAPADPVGVLTFSNRRAVESEAYMAAH